MFGRATRRKVTSKRIWVVGLACGFLVFCALISPLVLDMLALLVGYFDEGKFEAKQAQWLSGRVAMVAERSDHEAMSSDTYFVLIGNHVFSPHELWAAYYQQREVFSAAAGDCGLSVQWSDEDTLVISCETALDSDSIDSEKHRKGDIAVRYLNIPEH
jgi:hypothetical protein